MANEERDVENQGTLSPKEGSMSIYEEARRPLQGAL
jgi:hypothetical protein